MSIGEAAFLPTPAKFLSNAHKEIEKTGKKKLCFARRYAILFKVFQKKGMNTTVLNLLVPATFYRPELETVYYAINYTLIALMAVAALAAIVLVMLQPGNSQGIDALGGTSETFYGKNKGRSIESKLKMWTVICLAVLAVLAVVFFILQIPQIWGEVL